MVTLVVALVVVVGIEVVVTKDLVEWSPQLEFLSLQSMTAVGPYKGPLIVRLVWWEWVQRLVGEIR